jgi:hypothetical protein
MSSLKAKHVDTSRDHPALGRASAGTAKACGNRRQADAAFELGRPGRRPRLT